ncbi:ABC transporter permease [Mycobacterium sp. 155]|uniref:ABC transporter permease n=1 Tax=Mycobacterium sp. 155 TaxID=1157943 RepID=UPI0012F7759C|nr:ABC transporter permease [Mycobacterium sp. 155]
MAAATRSRRGRWGLLLAAIPVATAVIGPLLVSTTDTTNFVAPPMSTPGGAAGLFGTDQLGRSVLDRTLDGGLQLLVSAAVATAVILLVGSAVGIVAAYEGGWTELLLMRSADVLLVIPQLVFALVLVSISGQSQILIVLAVAISQAPQTARVVYSCAQNVCEQDYVKVVRLWGAKRHRIFIGQVLPNLITPLSVEAGLRLSYSIIMIAGLNFLGFGVRPPAPSWGVMINENRIGLGINPWGVVVPTVLLALLAVGTNMFTDALARVSLGERGAESLELSSSLPQDQQ